jgi:hypothetical protein
MRDRQEIIKAIDNLLSVNNFDLNTVVQRLGIDILIQLGYDFTSKSYDKLVEDY